jgi:hypothetical protein
MMESWAIAGVANKTRVHTVARAVRIVRLVAGMLWVEARIKLESVNRRLRRSEHPHKRDSRRQLVPVGTPPFHVFFNRRIGPIQQPPVINVEGIFWPGVWNGRE